MAKFTDRDNRVWDIDINVGSMIVVKNETGVHLGKLLDDKMAPLAALLNDQITLVNVIYCLCREQAENAEVTDVDFGRALAGDQLEEASNAFLDALADFFPSRQRKSLRTLTSKINEAADALAKMASDKISEINPEKLASTLSESHSSLEEL